MTIQINDVRPWVEYDVGATPTDVFTVPFEFFEDDDLKVYVDTTLKDEGTDYTVEGAGETGGGTVTFASTLTNVEVTIFRDIPVERLTSFPTAGPFSVPALNDELSRIVAMIADRERDDEFVLRVDRIGGELPLGFIPSATTRANKVLSFDSAGNPAVLSQLDKSADTVQATGATTARSFAAHQGNALTPMDFGASGDGVADDTAEIQAALDYCADNNVPLDFAGRDYKITAALTLTGKSEVYLDLRGAQLTLTRTTPGAGLILDGCTNIWVAGGDLRTTSDTTNNTGFAIVQNGSVRCHFLGCHVRTGGTLATVREVAGRAAIVFKDANTESNWVSQCSFAGWWRGVHCQTGAGQQHIISPIFEQCVIGVETNSADCMVIGASFNNTAPIGASHADINGGTFPILFITDADRAFVHLTGEPGASARPYWLKAGAADNQIFVNGNFTQVGTDSTTVGDNLIATANDLVVKNLTAAGIILAAIDVQGVAASRIERTDAATNSTFAALDVVALSSGTVAAGFGPRIRLRAEQATGVETDVATIEAILTDATNGSEDGELAFRVIVGGSILQRYKMDNTAVFPVTDDLNDLGKSGQRWDDVFATNTTIQSSDERAKEQIAPLDKVKVAAFLAALEPIAFKFKDRLGPEPKVHHRKHWGLSAQQVLEAMNAAGIATEEFAGIVIDEASDFYGLRMGEFVPMLLAVCKDLAARVTALEA